MFWVAFLYAGSLWFLFTVEDPPCGWGWPSACQGFLVEGACIFVSWVNLDLFSLECNEVSSGEFLGVYGFGVTLGSLYINAQGYVPALLEN